MKFCIHIGLGFFLLLFGPGMINAQNWIGTTGTTTTLYRTGKTGIGMPSAPTCNPTIFEVDSSMNILARGIVIHTNYFNCAPIHYAPNNNNLFAGYGAGANNANTSGDDNSFFGQSAGNSNIYGSRNSYFGKFAGEHNEGNDNVILGSDALAQATSVNESVYIGAQAGVNAMASENVVIGFEAGHEIQQPTNTLIGFKAGRNADWANENTMVGYETGLGAITASGNTFLGYLAGKTVDTDHGNTFIGAGAGTNYIGSGSDGFNTTLGSNTVVDNFVTGSTAIGSGSRVCDNNTIVLGSGTGGANEVVVIGDCKSSFASTGELEVVGHDIWANGTPVPSDERLKRNINKLSNPLEILSKLNGYTYFYKDSADTGYKLGKGEKAGVLAQELIDVYPFPLKLAANGYYGVDYEQFIPLLIEGLKKQQEQIDFILNSFDESETKKEEKVNDPERIKGMLFQNNPNPFSESTMINFEIYSEYSSAEIRIYDLAGNLRLKADVAEEQFLVIDGHKLDPGIYAYTLIIDGVSADTRTLVVAK